MPGGHTCLDFLWQLSKAGRIGNAGRCSLAWEESEMGMHRKIGAGIKTQVWQPWEGGPTKLWGSLCHKALGNQKVRCSRDAEFSCSSLEECSRDAAGRKGVQGLLLVGQEKVLCGFWLRTGDPGNTADGAGACGRPASWARITGRDWESSRAAHFYFFSWDTVPLPGLPGQSVEGRTVCVCLWVF